MVFVNETTTQNNDSTECCGEEEMGEMIVPPYFDQPQEEKSARSLPSSRRTVAIPWIYAVVGFVTTVLVVTAVVLLGYTYIVKGVEVTVIKQAETLLGSAVDYIAAINAKAEKNSEIITRILERAGNASSTTQGLYESLNATWWRQIVLRSVVDSTSMGHNIAIMGPPVPMASYPEQDLSVQGLCTNFCARPGEDPLFNEVSNFGVIRDLLTLPDGGDELRLILPVGNNTAHSTLTLRNRTATAPSWARETFNEKAVPAQLQEVVRGPVYQIRDPLALFGNGTAFDGVWSPVVVTTSPSGRSYYQLTHRQSFIHPLSNHTIIVSSLVSVTYYQNVITGYARLVGGNNGHLILVDGLARVVGYNRDPNIDSRLVNCITSTVPGAPNRQCENFFAIGHASPFVRGLFARYQSYILAKSSGIRTRWFNDDIGTRYLLAVMSIKDVGASRVIATYSLREEDVLGDLKRDAVLSIVLNALLAMAACVILTLAGFLSLYNANGAVSLASKVATRIEHYDVDGAEKYIRKVQAARMCLQRGQTGMEAQFELILGNLRIYRPFLPVGLLIGRRGSSATSANESFSSEFSVKPLDKFAVFFGTVILVDVGNLPIATTVMYREQARLDRIVEAFLTKCVGIIERYHGVVETIRANQVMASFNCHMRVGCHQEKACRCALELQSTLTGSAAWCEHRINVAVSVVTGGGLVGSCGSEGVRARVIAGECVDLIRKLPALQRMLGAGVLITEDTAKGLPATMQIVPVDNIQPKWLQGGRTEHLRVYELLREGLEGAPKPFFARLRQRIFAAFEDPSKRDRLEGLLSEVPGDLRNHYATRRLEHLIGNYKTHQLREGGPPIGAPQLRRECPWEELEGSSFYEQNQSHQQLRYMGGPHSTSCNFGGALRPSGSFLSCRILPFESLGRESPTLPTDCLSTPVNTYRDPSAYSDKFGICENWAPFPRQRDEEMASPLFKNGGMYFGGSFCDPQSSSLLGSSHPSLSSLQNRRSEGSTTNDEPTMYDRLFAASKSSSALSSSNLENRPQMDSTVLVAVSGDRYFRRQGADGNLIALHENGGLVAVKQLPLDNIPDGSLRALSQEVEVLSKLHHTNIRSYVSCAVDAPTRTLFFLMEYIPCGTLYDLLRQCGPTATSSLALPISMVVKCSLDIAEGLHYLHTRTPPIIHRDVQPCRIRMTESGSCKLIDYMNSMSFLEGRPFKPDVTSMYTPPEVISSYPGAGWELRYTPASDAYSLGATMAHLLFGVAAADVNRIFFLVSQRIIPPALSSLVVECLSPDPSLRPTFNEIIRQLKSLKDTKIGHGADNHSSSTS
jgi:class 3 adenylate cyclase